MVALYRGADAYVLPSRGEGCGLTNMEALACGLPTIATGWSGNTEYMHDGNSFLVDYELVDLDPAAWSQLRAFRGQQWAEPSVPDLRAAMRRVIDDREEAARRGQRGRAEVLERYSVDAVGQRLRERLTHLAATG